MLVNQSKPRVSIILPAYNAGPFVRQAIDSVLSQTFGDFELVVIDDCSTDDTIEAVRAYSDPRLFIFRNQQNLGLVATLNRGFAHARGDTIARMDADDISLPGRLAMELELMESDPRLGIVSCGYQEFSSASDTLRSVLLPSNDAGIRRDLYCKTHCFCHAAALMRREAVEEVGGYRQEWFPAEDRDLWLRMLEVWHGANVPEVLYRVRAHRGSVSATNARRQSDLVVASTVGALQRHRAPGDVDPAVSCEAWARGHLFAAFGLATRGETSSITHHFNRAEALDRDVAHGDFEELLNDRIADYMHNHEADVFGAEALVRRVFAVLPQSLAKLRGLQPAMLAQVRAISAFHHAQAGARVRAQREALMAMVRDRQQIRNRGLVKIALRIV